MSALAALVKSAGVVGANGPQFLVGSIFNGQLAKVARTATSMHAAQFTEQEVMRIVKALYLSDSKQDARDAWAVLDRRKIGSIPRVEIEESLVDIFGDKSTRRRIDTSWTVFHLRAPPSQLARSRWSSPPSS